MICPEVDGTSLLLLLDPAGTESGTEEGDDETSSEGLEEGSRVVTIVGVATIVEVWDISTGVETVEVIIVLDTVFRFSDELVWFPKGTWRRSNEGKLSVSIV